MINTFVGMGRLTYTPELRHTNGGDAVANFQIAVDRNYAPAGQEKQTDFLDCVAWKQTAEFLCKWFQNGSMIALVGNVQTRNYTDKQGNARKAVEIVANNISFCGSKNESQASTERDNDSYDEWAGVL